MTFVVGAGQVAPWLDAAASGLRPGDAAAGLHGSLYVLRAVRARSRAEGLCTPLPGVGRDLVEAVDEADREAVAAASESRAAAQAPTSLETMGCASGEEGDGAKRWAAVCEERSAAERAAGNKIVTSGAEHEPKGLKKIQSAIVHYWTALDWSKQACIAKVSEAKAEAVLAGAKTTRPSTDEAWAETCARAKVEYAAQAVKCLNNVAVAMAKLNEWQSILVVCDAVEELEPGNAKAVYKRGQALARLKLFRAAEIELRRAVEIFPNDKGPRLELASCRKGNVDLLRKTRREFSETYSFMCKSPIYNVVDEEDRKMKDTGRLTGFSRGFMC